MVKASKNKVILMLTMALILMLIIIAIPLAGMGKQVEYETTPQKVQYQTISVGQLPIKVYPSELRPGSTKFLEREEKTYAMIAPLYGECIEILSVVNCNPGIDIRYKVTKLATSDYWAEAKAVVFTNPAGGPVGFVRDGSSSANSESNSGTPTITYKAPAVIAGKGFVVPETVTLKVGEVREVHFTAYPEEGYFVDYWQTPKGKFANPIIPLFLGRDKQNDSGRYKVAFREPITYKVSLSSSPGGVITPGPGTYSYTETETNEASFQHLLSSLPVKESTTDPSTYPFTPGIYTRFDSVAKAEEGYLFCYWEIRSKTKNTEDPNNTLSYSFGPSSELTEFSAKAIFKKKSEVKRSTITYKIQGKGTIFPEVGTYYFYPNESSSYSATPSEGWKFVHWKYYRDGKYVFKTTEPSGTHWAAILNDRYDWTLVAVFTKK
jgi:hypothetical protein